MAAMYSIQAPDGRTYRIEGPDGASQDQVQAQVLRQFPNAGREGVPAPAAARPGTRPTEQYLMRYRGLRPEQAAQLYQNQRQAVGRRFSDPAQRARTLARFDNDPRVQAVRQVAGLMPMTTPRAELQETARAARSAWITETGRRESRERQRNTPAILSAFSAGAVRSLFGIPERVLAAVEGRDSGLNYQERLQRVRARTDEQMSRSTTGNVLGQITGSVGSGLGVGGLIAKGAARLASSATPIISGTGNVLQRLTQLQQGQRTANVARISAAGSTGGAAQAVGEGSDVRTGAVAGAIAAPVFHGGIQLVRQSGRLLRQATRPFSRSTSRALREVVTEAPEAVAARHADLEARTGAPVPVVAALRDRDFRAVTEKVLRRSPEATEVAKTHTGAYVRNFMNRMLGHVNRAGRTGSAQNTSIGQLAELRQNTANGLMEPIRDQTVDLTMLPLEDLERRVTRQIGGRIQGLAPRINQALRDLRPADLEEVGLDATNISAARRLLTQWGLGQPVRATVQEMDGLRRALDAASRSAQGSNPANAMAFRNASKIVREFVAGEVPAYGQMVDTYAAQSRMMEGFETAASGRRINDIADDLLRGNLRTPEGRIGMKAGELFRQREAVSGRTTGAISAARDFAAEGNLTRPRAPEGVEDAARPGTVTENLGDEASANLARASQGETRVLGRVLDTEKVNILARDEEGALSAEDIVYSAFLGNAMAATKARLIARLLAKIPHGINKRVASNLADMLFSQDPAKTAQAMRALHRAGLGEQVVTGLMRGSLPANIAVGALAGGRGAPGEDAPPDPSGEIPSVEADLAAGATPQDGELPEELQGAPQPVTPGNLPFDIQNQVQNEDGSVSTVLTMSIGTDRGEVLIPRIIDGHEVSEEEAIQHFQETGENFGTFRSAEDATAYAGALHNYHARRLNERGEGGGPTVEGNSPYTQQLQEIYDNEDPALLDLVSRVESQESGGNQFDPDTGQPLESDAGAIGVMQVMPETGPEAARLAGIRWDPRAYSQDGTYNRLLGIAYLSEQLRRYDGDVRLALIAYNAGPERADSVARGGRWMPPETQDYLASILG